MGTQITRLTRLAAAGLSAVLLFATTACAATSPAETEPDNKTSVPAPTGPINVVASLNQWGSLAAELGGDDVEVTSIVNSTNVDAHDFEPKTSDVAKLSKAQIIVANGAGYDSWATKSMTKTTNIVSAASVMGAVEGDNPHLWFSKDARSSMATAITDAYIKELPSKKKAFQKRLKAWQAELINTIIDAVDPSYGCEDATDGDTADSNANSDDSSAEGSATDDANAQDSKASTGSSTDPKYIRQCKAAASSDSSQDSAKADAANGDSGDASGNDQTDSGK